MQLDIDFVRSRFPAFSDPSLEGWAFFENAGGSYPCAPVVERLHRFYRSRKVQPYAPYPAAQAGGAEMDEARERLAAMLGVETDEVSFGPSTSANTYVLAQAFRGWLKPGDAIVVTDQDHEANAGAWRRLAEAGIVVREWRLDPATGHLDPVCFPHASNVVAEINDVAAICRMVHEAGAVACVDGVSYAPHGLPDVGALGADIYLFSAYKTYGPHQGIMVIRRALGEALPNQGHHFNGGTLWKRFTPAGPDHAQIAACAGIADYIDELHAHHGGGDVAPRLRAAHVHDRMRDAEVRRLAPLMERLAAKNLRVLGPRDPALRAPTVAIDLGRDPQPVAEALAARRIMAWGGDFYAVRPLRAMGIDPDRGVLRLSFVHYTSEAEVARLIDALDDLL
jgi:selenocysteine lyase/cysteine desulfurase